MESWQAAFMAQMMYMAPVFVVDIVAIFLALLHRRRHPRASWLFAVAIATFLVLNTAGTFFLFWLSEYLRSGQAALVISAAQFVRNLIGAAAWVLVTIAFFCDRSPQPDAAARNDSGL